MKEPAFWRTDGGRGSGALTRALLSPLGRIYAWAVARRIRKTEPVDPGVPVICVGNITLGGTGKTPVTQSILRRLEELDCKPCALSRGYGGSEAGPLEVLDTHSATQVGDEPLLLAHDARVWISRDRVEGAHAAVEAEVDVIVMDDGHQNPTLKKTLSIVVIDSVAGWGANLVFPAGPLREPVPVGLARADAVIVMTPDQDAVPNYARLQLSDLEIPVLQAWLEPREAPPKGRLLAFAGIGRPQKFFDALEAAGAQLTDGLEFPDHHPYSERDLAYLRDHAASHEAKLITTEKDWVRLPVDVRADILAWPVEARFANPAALDALLLDIVDARPSAR